MSVRPILRTLAVAASAALLVTALAGPSLARLEKEPKAAAKVEQQDRAQARAEAKAARQQAKVEAKAERKAQQQVRVQTRAEAKAARKQAGAEQKAEKRAAKQAKAEAKAACKEGGWTGMVTIGGNPFPNQGQCVSYALSNQHGAPGDQVAVAAPTVQYRTFGSADVTEGPAGTFTIVSDGPDPVYDPAPEYGGVYLNSRSQSGKAIGSVDFSFVSSGDVAGGAPRLSIPIDMDKNGTVDDYLSIGASNCIDDTNVTTTGTNCMAYLNSDGPTGLTWDAWAAVNPTWRVAPGASPFIIADGAHGTYVVSDIVLR